MIINLCILLYVTHAQRKGSSDSNDSHLIHHATQHHLLCSKTFHPVLKIDREISDSKECHSMLEIIERNVILIDGWNWGNQMDGWVDQKTSGWMDGWIWLIKGRWSVALPVCRLNSIRLTLSGAAKHSPCFSASVVSISSSSALTISTFSSFTARWRGVDFFCSECQVSILDSCRPSVLHSYILR